MPLPRMVDLARAMVAGVLVPGDVAIDATVGNGRDTLWLARLVGPSGRVLGLDIQHEALRGARNLLATSGVEDRVLLVECGHERLDALLPERGPMARPKVVMFNLGDLPGGDHSIVTEARTTLAAVSESLRRAAPGGIVTVVLYPGHPSGRLESDLILDWVTSIAEERAAILRCEVFSKTRSPTPWLLVLSPPKLSPKIRERETDRDDYVRQKVVNPRCLEEIEEVNRKREPGITA